MQQASGVLARWLAAAAFSALVCCANGAHAAEALIVRYVAPDECPSRESFREDVLARAGSARKQAPALAVRVRIVPGSDGLRGTLVIGGPSRAQTIREVRGDDCQDVASALALIVAILLNPDGQQHDRTEARDPRSERRAPPPSVWRQWTLLAGSQLAFQTGIAPRALIGPRWFAGIARRQSGSLLSSARLSVYGGRSRSVDGPMPATSAAFELDSLRVDGCLVELSAAALSVEPCVLLEGGTLHATGTTSRGSVRETLSWAATGTVLRGRWRLWRALAVELELGATLPLTSTRYSFAGEADFYDDRSLGLSGGLGLGVYFP